MAKYKVGDTVIVKSGRTSRKSVPWCDPMDEFLGKTVTIRQVDGDDNTYRIKGTSYWFCEEAFEGLANSTGNEVIDLLMEKLGVEIGEEFEIIGSGCSPFHFRTDGKLVDKDGFKWSSHIGFLAFGIYEIKKIPKPEIKEMTVAELEETLKLPKGSLRVKGDD